MTGSATPLPILAILFRPVGAGLDLGLERGDAVDFETEEFKAL